MKAFPIFESTPDSRVIKILPTKPNPTALGSQVRFYGFEACFSKPRDNLNTKNRGNALPKTYDWALEKLPVDALVLDCGSGDRRHGDRRVVDFEYMPFELPDVFGDGHLLPFADNCFDSLFSQAVLEHMRDPYLAAREIARVTKAGGLIYAESAFMQPIHAVPFHFLIQPYGE